MKTLKTLYLPILALLAMLVSSACGCIENKLPITKDELIGKTKEEVLQIAFEKSPRIFKEESVRISAMTDFSKDSQYSYYYENASQVLENEHIMNSDIWGICYTESYMIIKIQVDYWMVKFENNKVVGVEKRGYAKM